MYVAYAPTAACCCLGTGSVKCFELCFFSLAAAVSTPLSLEESDRFSNCQRLDPGCEDEKWFAFTGTDPASSTIRA